MSDFSPTPSPSEPRIRVYLAGPITGIPDYVKRFADVRKRLTECGYHVVDPAAAPELAGWTWADYLRRALRFMLECEEVAVLPGWQNSRGARLEIYVALALGMPVWDLDGNPICALPGGEPETPLPPPPGLLAGAPPLPPPQAEAPRSVLEEALEIVRHARAQSYGPPGQDFARTVAIFKAWTGHDLTPIEGIMFMICVKMSRQAHCHKRDNWVDICGYADCGYRVEEGLP